MNLALSIAAPSALAGGEAIGGLSWARAPETISPLTAADIIRVLSILASKRVCSRKREFPPLQTNSRARGVVPRVWNPPRTREGVCAVQRTGSSEHEREAHVRRARAR